MHITRILLASLLAASLAACDDDPTTPHEVATVRIVNAAPGTSSVDVILVGTTTPLATLNFRGVTTTCVEVPAGGAQQGLTFRSAGADLATAVFTPLKGERYTVVLTASGATRRAVALSDNESAVAGNNAIRLINATSAPGDVYATAPGATPAAANLVAGNLGVFATSNATAPYYSRASTDTEVRLFDVGTTTNPRADITLTALPASRMATVVFTDPGTPAGPTAFVVTPCE